MVSSWCRGFAAAKSPLLRLHFTTGDALEVLQSGVPQFLPFDFMVFGRSASLCGYPATVLTARRRQNPDRTTFMSSLVVNVYSHFPGMLAGPRYSETDVIVFATLGDLSKTAMEALFGIAIHTYTTDVRLIPDPSIAPEVVFRFVDVPDVKWGESLTSQATELFSSMVSQVQEPVLNQDTWSTNALPDALAQLARHNVCIFNPTSPRLVLEYAKQFIDANAPPSFRTCVLNTLTEVLANSPCSWDFQVSFCVCCSVTLAAALCHTLPASPVSCCPVGPQTQGVALSTSWDDEGLSDMFFPYQDEIVVLLSRICVDKGYECSSARYGALGTAGCFSVLLLMDTDPFNVTRLSGVDLKVWIEANPFIAKVWWLGQRPTITPYACFVCVSCS